MCTYVSLCTTKHNYSTSSQTVIFAHVSSSVEKGVLELVIAYILHICNILFVLKWVLLDSQQQSTGFL